MVQRFYFASLGKDQFILGFPWLAFFNPNIDWCAKKILGPPLHIEETTRSAENEPHILRHAQIVARRLELTPEWEEGDELILHIDRINIAQEWAIQDHQNKTPLTEEGIPDEYQ